MGASWVANSLRTWGKTWSSPQALLGSNPESSFWIPFSVKHMSGMLGNSCGLAWASVIGVSVVNADWNWWLRISALPLASPTWWPVSGDFRADMPILSVRFLLTNDQKDLDGFLPVSSGMMTFSIYAQQARHTSLWTCALSLLYRDLRAAAEAWLEMLRCSFFILSYNLSRLRMSQHRGNVR